MANLDIISGAMLTVLDNVGHYKALKKKPPYCIWAEDGAIALRSDNKTLEQALTGTADYFTLEESDSNVADIQRAFDISGVSWYLNSVQYEEDTDYIHYEWVWSVG